MTLSPSSASRRMACPGSYKLENMVPKNSSEYAQEGILAHRIAADVLKYGEYTCLDEDLATEEMFEGARLYAGFIRARCGEFTKIHIEEPLDISSIHPECRGIPDAWAILPNMDIDIYDYKFGHGFVEVFENWQLLEYAAGVLQPIPVSYDTFINMHIIQPRSFHPNGQIRTWRINVMDIQNYFSRLQVGERAATSDNPITIVNNNCNYCAARHICPALQVSSMSAIDISNSAIPHYLTPNELSTELKFLQHSADILNARISGLSAEALAMISRGERLPHHYADRGKGRERWRISEEDIAALGEIMGIPLSKPVVITPKQAIALKSPLLPKERIHQLSEIPEGALKLMPIDTRKTDKIFGVG